MNFSPIIQRRFYNFKKNRRGYISAIIFLTLFILSLFAELIANDKPLIVKYQGQYYFPITKDYYETKFGGDFPVYADYRDPLIKQNIEKDGFMLWPLVKFSYDTINFDLQTPTPAPPSKDNLLGTDDQGRDLLARLIYGFRLSVIFGLSLTFFSSLIGIIAGAIQGYFGGKVDILMQRFIEIWGGLPQLFILIIISSIIEPSFMSLLVILLMFSWTSLVGVVRAEFFKTRNMEYVKAARALGLSDFTIIYKHVLPNALTATFSYTPFILSGSIVALASLDFLGLGLSADYPSLGDIIRQGKDNLNAPWLGLSAFITLGSLLSMLVFMGEAIRDAFDPRKNYA